MLILELRVVDDQIGAPTSADLVAKISVLCISKLIENNLQLKDVSGIYHLTSIGQASWYDFAKCALIEAQNLGEIFLIDPLKIIPISSSELLLPAIRPLNSLLNTDKLCKTFNVALPNWELSLKKIKLLTTDS